MLLEVGAAATHAVWFADHADDYGPTIRELVLAGLGRSQQEALQAERVRTAARAAIGPLIDAADALVTPVAPSSAPPRTDGTGDGSLCAPWSTIGVPAISLPTGLDGDGLPFAIQLVGAADASARLLEVAAWCEQAIGFDARPRA